MRITTTHVYFWDGFLSNWHPAPIAVDGLNVPDSETLFMVLKAKHFKDDDIARQIIESTHPGDAKKLGRQIKNFDNAEWDRVKLGVMVNACILKFRQNQELLEQLLDTGTRTLVEASPYDKVWGVGLKEDNDAILDEKNWLGENLLGKALMEVRTYFGLERQMNQP